MAWRLTPEARAARKAEADRVAEIRLCRKDVVHFVETRIPAEDGKPIVVTPYQRAWYADLVSPKATKILVSAFPSAGKSQTLANWLVWRLGLATLARRPESNLLVGPSKHVTERQVSYVARLCELPGVQEVFPGLQRGATWRADAITLQGFESLRFEALRGVGPMSRILSTAVVEGAVIVDDLIGRDTAANDDQRKKLVDWFWSELATRPRGPTTKLAVFGISHHPADLISDLRKRDDWRRHFVPVMNADGEPTWPEAGWTREIIDRKREEMGSPLFTRTYMLDVESEQRHFRPADIRAAVERGRGYACRQPKVARDVFGMDEVCGYDFIVGVDPAWSSDGDRSAIVTIGVGSPTDTNGRFVRVLVDAEAGHWSDRELAQRVVAAWYRYRPVRLVVESNGAQRVLASLVKALDPKGEVEVTEHVTSRKTKFDERAGVTAISSELEAGLWVLPSDVRTGEPLGPSKLLIDGMLSWTPTGHVDDVLMAAHLANYYAEDAALWLADKRTVAPWF